MTVQRAGLAAVVLALIVGGAVTALIGAYVRDDMKLDRIVRTVALDWRDFGEEKARTRLQYELDAQAIGAAIGDDDCKLELHDGGKRVSCAWGVDVVIPGVGTSFPMHFASDAWIAPDGDLQ